MRIAIVHDYLNQKGGAERVVEVLHKMFPDAPVFTLLYNPGDTWEGLRDADIRVSWINKFSFVRRHFKLFYWLYPLAIRTLRVRGYDVILSSSSAYAKGVAKRGAFHICYCHTPMRFAWNTKQYVSKDIKNILIRLLIYASVPFLRMWDIATSSAVDVYVANSNAVRQRIRSVYKRDSRLVFPPVTLRNVPKCQRDDFFLVVSRLVAYKRIDLAIEACEQLGKTLFIIGTGPDEGRLRELAGRHTKFLGWCSETEVTELMAKCGAFIFPGEEDFGMTPVEAMSTGAPVIAYKAGGALDTVTEGVTGNFFSEPTVLALQDAIVKSEQTEWNHDVIRRLSRKFAEEHFVEEIRALLEERSGHVNKFNYERSIDEI